MFNGYDAISEEGGPKVARSNDFLGSVHAREVNVVGSHVVIIKHMFNFNLCEATSKEVLTGVKITCNKGRHCPFRKSQLDSRTFGMAGSTGLWTYYCLKFGLW